MPDVLGDYSDVGPEGGSFAPGTGTADFTVADQGFGDFASGLYNSLSNSSFGFGDLTKALGLGLGGLNTYLGAKGASQSAAMTKLAQDAAKTAKATAQPVSDFASSQLQMGQEGKIPPAIQAQIDNWSRAAKQQVLDYAARSGLGSSEWLNNRLAWVDQQAQAMQAQALQGEESTGIQAAGVAGNILGTQGQIAQGQQGSMENLIASANQMLGRMTGSIA
jgi:hypothetical protein